MNYSDLKLTVNEETNIAVVKDGIEIEVKKYLPIEDKIDLVQIALQKSLEDGVYNEIKLNMYFDLYLIYMYTNLTFTDEEREDEFKLYDELESNNIIISVIGAMEDDEYDYLVKIVKKMQGTNQIRNNSAAAIIRSIIQDLPSNAAAAAEIMDNFDPQKYKEIETFAQAANAGRPIS